jgi:hypothetical protein
MESANATLEVLIPSAVAVIAVGLYVVALWIGDDHTVSLLSRCSNLSLGGIMTVVGLATLLGVSLTFAVLVDFRFWLRAVAEVIEQL